MNLIIISSSFLNKCNIFKIVRIKKETFEGAILFHLYFIRSFCYNDRFFNAIIYYSVTWKTFRTLTKNSHQRSHTWRHQKSRGIWPMTNKTTLKTLPTQPIGVNIDHWISHPQIWMFLNEPHNDNVCQINAKKRRRRNTQQEAVVIDQSSTNIKMIINDESEARWQT